MSPTCNQYCLKDITPGVMVWAVIGYITQSPLVWIDSNFNISGIHYPVVVSYLWSLPNAIFQQGNARPHIGWSVLTSLDTQNIGCRWFQCILFWILTHNGFYFQGLLSTIFQQDNTTPHVAHDILTLFDTQAELTTFQNQKT